MYCGSNKTAMASQRQIAEAMMRLIQEKPYAQITISELCKSAGISRQTFYTLFSSRENVVTFTLQAQYCYAPELPQFKTEQEQFIGGIRAVLAKHGGAWYTTDFGVDYEQFAARNMASPESAALYQTAKKQSMQQSNIFNGVFVLKTEAEKQAFLEANGLKVEKLPFYHGDENLQMLHAVLPEKKDVMLDQLGKSTFWKMTLGTSAFVREKIAGAKEVDNLRIDYAIEGNVLSCSPTGRIDTISAPVLLEILEQNGAGLKEMKLDASNLEYISSAGLRVLLMAVKSWAELR